MFLGPAPWGPGEGSKGKISFYFSYKVNFKDFLYQSLYVFSQIKDIKHIKQVILFCSLCLAQELGLGGVGAHEGLPGGQFFSQTESCGISN